MSSQADIDVTTHDVPSPAIEIDDLRFDYPSSGDRQPFGLDIDAWRLERGDAVAIYGPSGSGKSTFLELIAGILTPACGSLRIAGTDLAALDERQRRAYRLCRMGMIFQDYPLIDHLEVLDNVTLPYRLQGDVLLDGPVSARAQGLLERLGLADRERDLPTSLSQGERQRVAIARALVTQPRLVLADEPTAGLDAERGAAVVDLLRELCGGDTGLLLVSHDPAVLQRFDIRVDIRQWRRIQTHGNAGS